MKYTEAMTFKQEIGEQITISEMVYNVYIAPKKHTDYLKFILYFNEETYDDNTCKKFSTNNDFGLCMLLNKDGRQKIRDGYFSNRRR